MCVGRCRCRRVRGRRCVYVRARMNARAVEGEGAREGKFE